MAKIIGIEYEVLDNSGDPIWVQFDNQIRDLTNRGYGPLESEDSGSTWTDPNPYQLTAQEKYDALQRAYALQERLRADFFAKHGYMPHEPPR